MDKLAEIRIPGVWNTKSRLIIAAKRPFTFLLGLKLLQNGLGFLDTAAMAISRAVVWAIGRNKMLARVMVNMKG